MTDVLLDYDYHPPGRLQLFTIDPAGGLRPDDEVLVTAVRHGESVLRHYAFADRWFTVNWTTDVSGRLRETGSSDGDAPPLGGMLVPGVQRPFPFSPRRPRRQADAAGARPGAAPHPAP